MNVVNLAKISVIVLLVLILVAVNIGFIRWSIWFQIFKLWPVFLIAIFLDFIFRYSGLQQLKLIPVVLVVASVIAVTYLSGLPDWFSVKNVTTQETRQSLHDSSVRSLSVGFEFNNGKLNIGKAPNQNDLYVGSITDYERVFPNITSSQSGTDFRLILVTNPQTEYLFGAGDDEHVWDFHLNDSVPIDLETKTNYSNNNFDLSDLKLRNLSINSHEDTGTVRLGDNESYAHVVTNLTFSRTTFYLPKNVGIKIRMDNKATSTNVSGLGFVTSGTTFTSPTYLTSSKKIDMDISASASAVDFQLY